MRAARKPSAVARELLRNFPKSGGRRRRRKRKVGAKDGGAPEKNGAKGKATQPADQENGFELEDENGEETAEHDGLEQSVNGAEAETESPDEGDAEELGAGQD